MDQYLQNLGWRYATQQFDTHKKLSSEQVNYLLGAARLSPSSFGLQPWKFIVVTDPNLRMKLRKEAGYDQPKISEASHLIVFCAQKDMSPADIKRYAASISQTRGISLDSLQGFGNMLNTKVKGLTVEQRLAWNKNQVYLSLGFLLSAAAQAHIDAGPMEGFDPQKFDQILGLEKTPYTTAVICAVGLRDKKDPAAIQKKVRYPQSEVVEWRK